MNICRIAPAVAWGIVNLIRGIGFKKRTPESYFSWNLPSILPSIVAWLHIIFKCMLSSKSLLSDVACIAKVYRLLGIIMEKKSSNLTTIEIL